MSRSVRQDYERYRRDPVGIALVEAIHRRKEMEISQTRFTPEELKLISRALNFYAEHPEYMSNERALGTECEDASNLATRIYQENFRIGMDNEPPKYRPTFYTCATCDGGGCGDCS